MENLEQILNNDITSVKIEERCTIDHENQMRDFHLVAPLRECSASAEGTMAPQVRTGRPNL